MKCKLGTNGVPDRFKGILPLFDHLNTWICGVEAIRKPNVYSQPVEKKKVDKRRWTAQKVAFLQTVNGCCMDDGVGNAVGAIVGGAHLMWLSAASRR